MLDDSVRNTGGAAPVGGIVEPQEQLVQRVHDARFRRSQGVSTCSMRTNEMSSATANTTVRVPPTNSGVLKNRFSPSKMKVPSPPWSEPRMPEIGTRPTVVTVAIRKPLTITGSAIG